jgi:hypothetical protein
LLVIPSAVEESLNIVRDPSTSLRMTKKVKAAEREFREKACCSQTGVWEAETEQVYDVELS